MLLEIYLWGSDCPAANAVVAAAAVAVAVAAAAVVAAVADWRVAGSAIQ